MLKHTTSSTKATAVVSKFSALGDPTRFRLMQLLIGNNEYCVSELATKVGISNAGVSQQLKILEQAELVDRVRNGQKICYKVSRKSSLNQRLLEMLKANE